MSTRRWLTDGTVREYRPSRRLITITALAIATVVAIAMTAHLPAIAEVTVVAVSDDALRVAGLELSRFDPVGRDATVTWSTGRVSGVGTEIEAIPDTNAYALVLRIEDLVGELPAPYEVATLDVGEQRLLPSLVRGLRP